MFRVHYRTGERTGVSAGPVLGPALALVLLVALAALVWRAAVALAVLYLGYLVVRHLRDGWRRSRG